VAITKVVPAVIAVTNNITSNTFGSANTIPSFQMDGSGVIVAASNTAITLTANSVANNQFQTGSVENYMRAQGGNSVFAGMRNRIINGAMMIDQRNAGAAATPTDGQYVLDRWSQLQSASSKYSVQQDSSANTVAGFTSSLKVTSLSSYSVTSTDYFGVKQPIEGFNTADLAFGTANAKTVTLSFWVRSSLTGAFGGSIYNATADRGYPFSYTIVAANTWEQKFITIPGDTTGTWVKATNGIGIQVFFSLGVGTTYGSGTAGVWNSSVWGGPSGSTSIVGTNGATWYITGVQFEAGSTPTPFEFRNYGTELAMCQRYFVRYGGNGNYEFVGYTNLIGTSGTDAYGCVTPPVIMRTLPTYSYSNLSLVDENNRFAVTYIASSGTNYGGPYGTEVLFRVASGLAQYRPYYIQMNGGTSNSYYLYLSAEL